MVPVASVVPPPAIDCPARIAVQLIPVKLVDPSVTTVRPLTSRVKPGQLPATDDTVPENDVCDGVGEGVGDGLGGGGGFFGDAAS